jgi:hypothetical protein
MKKNISFIYIYILTCPRKKRMMIRTSDICFIRRDFQQIELTFRTYLLYVRGHTNF